MKFKIIFVAILSSLIVISNSSSASPIRRLSRFLDDELIHINSALDEVPDSELESNNLSTSGWNVRNFYLRLQATVGFSFPNVLSVDLVPQIELVFHRKES